jgi:16S rRNA (cytidine1402-2'-O)-methyltransferase
MAASIVSLDDQQGGQSAPLNGLVLVSTPIGNLMDISIRARSVLARCDLILCEDTRHTGRLLTAFGIHSPMEALHEHNENAKISSILTHLRAKQLVALVSDAGTPLVSDPGYRLVRECGCHGTHFVRPATIAVYVHWLSTIQIGCTSG